MLWILPAVGFFVQQLAAMAEQQLDRNMGYAGAVEAAHRSGKPLLVVGGPWGDGGFRNLVNWPSHGHGDVCLDLNESSCRQAHFVHGNILDIPFPAGHFGAAFCSHVLEHMATPEDCFHAESELQRVADEVFLCVPGKQTLFAWLAPTHHLWVKLEDGRVKTAVDMRPKYVTGPR